jgi:hypothetical protein
MNDFYDPSITPATRVAPAPRPTTLAGKVVGLYDNTKEQADVILEAIGEGLKREHGAKGVRNFRGVHYSKPAPLATIEEMARDCDVVVQALGG